MNSIGFLETAWRDMLYALRTMRRNPLFALTAVLTLSLGIGGSTAMFTIIHSVLLKPLEYQDPDRLVQISGGSTIGRYEAIKSAARSYSEMGVFMIGVGNPTLSGDAGPEVLRAARVSANFLRILGVEPMLGRSFQSEEDSPGGPPVAMISAEFWQRRFGSDPLIVGKTMAMAGAPQTIIGVLPPGFKFPFPAIDVWLTQPLEVIGMPTQSRLLSPILTIYGRLRADVDIPQATAELAVLNQQYSLANPGMLDARRSSTEQVTPLKDQLVANVRSMLWMLFGAVGFVLLIGCANVASLLLARSTSRSREFAVRAAIGAGRARLIRQLLAESVLLAFFGGGLGVLLAGWSLNAVKGMTTFNLPRTGEIRLDGMVLGFATLISIATGVLFGLVPSLGASRPDLADVLRTAGSASSGGSNRRMRWFGVRGLLVTAQVALSIVLLIGATLLMESLARVQRVDPGFNPTNLLTMRLSLSPLRYDTDQKKAAFFDELIQRVQSLPGVRNAAVTWTLPMMGWAGRPVQLADRPPVMLNERPIAIEQSINPEYFRTLQIRLVRGREFTARDTLSAPPVLIINETMARRFWPEYPNGQDPIGQRILMGVNPQPAEIVGIVADVRQGLDSELRPALYRAYPQSPQPAVSFAVRTDGDPMRFVSSVRNQVLAIDPDQPISEVRTMEDMVEATLGQRRLVMRLLGLFAGVALMLAMVGMYGVIAYSVAQRTPEIGVRMALGAHPQDILRLLVRQGLFMTMSGVVLGLAGAFGLTRVLNSFLFEVSATDPRTFAGIALLFIVVALSAIYIPVRHATRIDPMAVLRHE
ncbi:MAG TPA: ABC transporter permease [Terriglobia bacterium]|nr:ABC transporter permease [Terriglobia bacterium]